MTTRTVKQATDDLKGAGYLVTPYPDAATATKLIVRQGDRTVATLEVAGGAVDDSAVAYLASEGHYDILVKTNG